MATTQGADLGLSAHVLTPRIKELRDAYFKAIPEICVERPLLLTNFHREHGLFGQDRISILDKAHAYRHVLSERKPVVWHQAAHARDGSRVRIATPPLFAGATTSKFKGVPLYPELIALMIWPELHSLSARPSNPYRITPREAQILNEKVFPYWMDHTVHEVARKRFERPPAPDGRPDGFELLQDLVFFIATKVNCISHTIPCFADVLSRGLRAMIKEAGEKGTTDFYKAIAEVMEGIITYSQNLADEAEQMARRERDPVRRKELHDLADVHNQVPEKPARTFREGLTSLWICWIALNIENGNGALSLGRLDQVLYPLYRQDRDSGRLSVDDALELVCSFYLKIGDHVPTIPETGEKLFGGTGSNQALTLGGVDANEHDAVNELTYVMLRATELMVLRDPNVNARYHPGANSDAYLRRVCEVVVTTGATPAIHNDAAIIQALKAKGDGQHAWDYGAVGCIEPCSCGRHFGHSGSLMLNLPSVLELALFNGKHRHTRKQPIGPVTGEVEDFKTFAEFQAAFTKQLVWIAGVLVEMNNCLGETHKAIYPTPTLSALFEGPMQSGKDVVEGGATINSSGVAIVGLGEVVDSLAAIEEVVYAKQEVSFRDLLHAIENDFHDGHDLAENRRRQALQARLANRDKTPKFGHSGAANCIAVWLTDLLDTEFAKHENYRGGRYRVGYWSMTNHAGFGRILGATPSGRGKGQNLPSGITPSSGMTPYITDALHAVASLRSGALSNGIALNIKIFRPDNPEPVIDRLAQYVKGYFTGANGGGMEVQFNVRERAKFLDACKHPDPYAELLVRVSGYTAYFKDLNPQMQKEIIDRTEYDLATGHSLDYPPYEGPSD